MAALCFSLLPHLKPNTISSEPPKPSFLRIYTTSTATSIYTSSWNKKKNSRGRALCSHGVPTATQQRKAPTSRTKPKSPVTGAEKPRKDAEEDRPVCPGCGVFMQDRDPNLPGYYKKKEPKEEDPDGIPMEDGEDEDMLLSKFDLDEDFPMDDGDELPDEADEEPEAEGKADDLSDEVAEEPEAEGKADSDEKWSDWDPILDDLDEEEKWKKELDGFTPPGVGYGNITEETLRRMKKEKISKAERKRKAREAERKAMEEVEATVCSRCYSLKHYGQVKNQKAENLIPDFDFDRLVVSSLMKPAYTSPVVVMVVDCVDFDGSFPKTAAKSLFKMLEPDKGLPRHATLPKLVLVATKVDLLPSQISPTRLDRWVRNRARAWGVPKLAGVYLVSAHKDLGVRNLLSFIKKLSGPRSNVWVIGAQNAGKSTLINCFAKKEGVKLTRLTEAAVPGTTLGVVRIVNLLPKKAKMYDTPGLLHPKLLSMRLNRDEQKMVEIRKELQPRSYRVKAGHTVHLGGLARLDVIQSSVETIYITVWASPSISLHLGKTENAEEVWNTHLGIRLQPPVGRDRLTDVSQWRQREMKVLGVTWEVNSLDIAISGLGWFSLGLKGEATVALWTYDGVEVTKRDPLVLDRAPFLERGGFLLPNAVSQALGNQGRFALEAKKAKSQDFLLEV